jgi:hypothetical protein
VDDARTADYRAQDGPERFIVEVNPNRKKRIEERSLGIDKGAPRLMFRALSAKQNSKSRALVKNLVSGEWLKMEKRDLPGTLICRL